MLASTGDIDRRPQTQANICQKPQLKPTSRDLTQVRPILDHVHRCTQTSAKTSALLTLNLTLLLLDSVKQDSLSHTQD